MRNISPSTPRYQQAIRCLFTIHCLLITLVCNSQNPSTDSVDDILEDYVVNNYVDDVVDWSEQTERLAEQISEPLNINSATREQLQMFPFLTPEQIENIQAYIYTTGGMKSTSELMLVKRMNTETVSLLRRFVCAQPVDNSVKKRVGELLKEAAEYGKHEAVARLDIPFYKRSGYTTSYYGPSLYQSVKYKFSYKNKIYVGFAGEKDAGEPFGALCNKQGYDYLSAHLLINNVGLLKTIIIGDYGLSFGQGLVVNTNLIVGKSAYAFSSPFITGGITRHTSMGESNYFRGSAATLALGQLRLSPFYSHRKIDAKTDDDGNITTIYTTGLHRTENEMACKHSATLQLAGGNLAYTGRRLHLGVTGAGYWLDKSYEPSLAGYRKYNIHGRRFYNIGADYGYRYKYFSWQGEVAKGSRGVALINKLRYTTGHGYKFMLIHRYYSYDYRAMFANAFSEGGSVKNENGWYAAAELQPFARCTLFASADLYSYPWMKYRISEPSSGVDLMLRATVNISGRSTLTADYRYKRGKRDVTGTGYTETLGRHRLRARIDYAPCELIGLRTSLQYNAHLASVCSNATGYSLSQSATLKPGKRLKIQAQLTYFNTDNYDTRVYVAESGMLYSFYSPSYYGHGLRWSMRAGYDAGRHLTLMCKAGQSIYFDRETIGTGDDMIYSNRKTDLQMLMRLKF